jgi:Protein of unknown function (DUF1559)
VGSVDDPANLEGWGWGTFILPYLDQTAHYQSLRPSQNSLPTVLASADLQPYLRTPLPVFRCPSDSGEELQNDNRTLSGFVLGMPASPIDPNAQVAKACRACAGGGRDAVAVRQCRTTGNRKQNRTAQEPAASEGGMFGSLPH